MQGQIHENLHGKTVTLTGDAELFGPCRVAKVTTNGFLLTVSTPAHHGITIDGSKNPADWGANVFFTVPVYPENAAHIHIVEAPDPFALEFRARVEAASGADGLAAFEWLVAFLGANPLADRTATKAAWIAWATEAGNKTYFEAAIDAVLTGFCNGSGLWADLAGFVLSRTPEAWAGLPVPTGEVLG
ncbi:hypothetical protein EPN96_06600 [bacterium]|nr:MAG: hypothetical protein EPN96_06600 [bacterium]